MKIPGPSLGTPPDKYDKAFFDALMGSLRVFFERIRTTIGTISDGDYGDVTVSGTGTVISIDNDAVTFAKMQDVTAPILLGRATAGSGDVEEITLGTNLSFTGTTLNAAGGGGGTPGGSDTQVQFNDGGAFGGDAAFVWDKTTNKLSVGVSGTLGSLETNGPAISVPFPLTSSATVSVDASKSNNFRLVLAHTMTISNPTNLVDGMILNFYLKQDATGSRVVTWDTKYTFAGGATFSVLSTAAGTVDFMSCYYDSTDDILVCVLNRAFS